MLLGRENSVLDILDLIALFQLHVRKIEALGQESHKTAHVVPKIATIILAYGLLKQI